MSSLSLRYGRSSIPLDDSERFTVLGYNADLPGLSDNEVGAAFDDPIGTEAVEELVSDGGSVLIVVPDAMRRTAAGQIVNLLVRRLIAAGIMPFDISVIFATGIHRQVTEKEKKDIVTPFIFQRVKAIDHSARDIAAMVRLGETSGGIPIELNRALLEHDHVITIGGVGFHYFAGFTGGRKLICPGLASARTISATHRLAFDMETRSRADGSGPGMLSGNPVHLAFLEAASKIKVDLSVNTIVNRSGDATAVFCGDPLLAHETACKAYAEARTFEIDEKYDLVVADCGGFPYDINIIQAQKSLDAATKACRPGGTIVLAVACSDGLGRDDLLKWFEASDSNGIADMLAENYQVNGQTAWNILKAAEMFDVRIITGLDEEICKKMRLKKAVSLRDALADTTPDMRAALIPSAAGNLFLSKNK